MRSVQYNKDMRVALIPWKFPSEQIEIQFDELVSNGSLNGQYMHEMS